MASSIVLASPEESYELIRRRLPEGGAAFVLQDIVDAMEAAYREEKLEDAEETDAVFAAISIKSGAVSPGIEISVIRMFGLFSQLVVSIEFAKSWRSLFLRNDSYCAVSLAEATDMFAQVRRTAWFRRYRRLKPANCRLQWRGADELLKDYTETIIPALREAGMLNCSLPDPGADPA